MENELNIPGFKHYELDSTYQAKLAAGEVNAKDLSFVKETGKIYTQGGVYGGGNYLEIRELKMNDDMTVTEEQKAYNIETFNKAQAGEAFALNVMGTVLDLGMVFPTSALFSLLVLNPFGESIMSLNIALFADGTFNQSMVDHDIVDTEMSDSSENAVQNKVVKAYVDNAVANAGGGSGECVADKFVRTLYGFGGELTDEQRAYNVETYQMFFSDAPPLVMLGPMNAEYNLSALPSSGEPVSLTVKNILRENGVILLQNVTLNSDGSAVGDSAPTVVPINCNLNEPQYARIYFTVGKDIKECNPCILGENGMRYFIDASHALNSESRGYLMEYNTFEKRYRILIDPSTYAITETEEITFGGSGGGGVSEDYVNTAIANAITTTLNTAV